MMMADRPEVARLRALSTMSLAELRSRANALPDLLAAVAGVMPLLDLMPIEQEESRETSAEVASLAGLIMETEVKHIGPASKKGSRMSLQTFHHYARSVAASALSQRADALDTETAPLPLDDAAARSLDDAQKHGQAKTI